MHNQILNFSLKLKFQICFEKPLKLSYIYIIVLLIMCEYLKHLRLIFSELL